MKTAMNIPEHPEIARCLATGYPHPERHNTILCVDCGAELAGKDTVFIWDGENLCEDCVKDRIEENIDTQTLAESLGIPWKSAYLMEES